MAEEGGEEDQRNQQFSDVVSLISGSAGQQL